MVRKKLLKKKPTKSKLFEDRVRTDCDRQISEKGTTAPNPKKGIFANLLEQEPVTQIALLHLVYEPSDVEKGYFYLNSQSAAATKPFQLRSRANFASAPQIFNFRVDAQLLLNPYSFLQAACQPPSLPSFFFLQNAGVTYWSGLSVTHNDHVKRQCMTFSLSQILE